MLCALFFIFPLLGCHPKQRTELAPFDGQRAYAEVEALVQFSPRDAGTPGGKKAAEHIFQRLEGFGVEAETDPFTDQTPDGEKTMYNVVGRIPGTTDRWIIFGSHFDTMPGIEGFQGANDSGSSTGVLLELARIISESKTVPETGILLAFFDGEEGIAGYVPGDGLHGSRRMATYLQETGVHKKTDAMVLFDMVGDKDLHLTIPANSSSELVKAVFDAARATSHREYVSLLRHSAVTDDHVPFLDIGIPAIDIIDFKFGSAPGKNDYWHTADDTLEHISAASLQISGDIALQLLKEIAFE